MSTLDLSFPISSISGRYSSTDRVHARANRTTGKTYGVALSNPNRQSSPTAAQQQSRAAFRATWQKVDAILSDPAARSYYTALWNAHTAACRHHRPLSQSAINALPTASTAQDNAPTTSQTAAQETTIVQDATLTQETTTSSTTLPTTSQDNTSQTTQIPLSDGVGGVSILRSRRTPFSTPRRMLFHILYNS